MVKICPKCGFEMFEGVLGYDHVVGHHYITELPKDAQKDDTKLRHATLDPKKACAVHAWICSKCGAIELYAKYG
jgi:hypothetical protein